MTASQQVFADKVVTAVKSLGVDAERIGEGVMCGVRLVTSDRKFTIGPYAVYSADAEEMAATMAARA